MTGYIRGLSVAAQCTPTGFAKLIGGIAALGGVIGGAYKLAQPYLKEMKLDPVELGVKWAVTELDKALASDETAQQPSEPVVDF